MKLKARVNNREYELIINDSGHILAVEIDGRSYTLEINEPEEGRYLLFNETRVFDCRVERRGAHERFNVSLRGHNHLVSVINPKRLQSDQSSDHHHDGTAEILAPMPGKVVRVLVEAGAEVEKGAGVVVVEAMKMQNEMKSPRSGAVISVSVKAGDTVNAGDVLAVVE